MSYNATVYVERHPDLRLGWVISSLLYPEVGLAAAEGEPDSGPSAEADTKTAAISIGRRMSRDLAAEGASYVELLVDGDEVAWYTRKPKARRSRKAKRR